MLENYSHVKSCVKHGSFKPVWIDDFGMKLSKVKAMNTLAAFENIAKPLALKLDKDGKEIAQKTAHFTPDPSEKKPSNGGRKRKAGPPSSEPAFPMITGGITNKVAKGEDADQEDNDEKLGGLAAGKSKSTVA